MRISRFILLALLVALFLLKPMRVAGDSNYVAASILAGEAPSGCDACIRVTACALARDIHKGVDLRSRWYGIRKPDSYSVYMMDWAMEDTNCDAVPKCNFVGNARDIRVWATKGWISSARVWCNVNGCTACAN